MVEPPDRGGAVGHLHRLALILLFHSGGVVYFSISQKTSFTCPSGVLNL